MHINPNEWPFAPGVVRAVEDAIAEFGKEHYPQCGWAVGLAGKITILALETAVMLPWPYNDPVVIVENVMRTIHHIESGTP